MVEESIFYEKNARELFEQYESIPFSKVHGKWQHLLPTSGNALDIGSGSGRDARFFADRGLNTFAVEPSKSLIEIAVAKHGKKIHWIHDFLPSLSTVRSVEIEFDIILLSAVWQHIKPNEREESLHTLSNLLSRFGILVISLRNGPERMQRLEYETDQKALLENAEKLFLVARSFSGASDPLERKDVTWGTIIFKKRL